MHPDRKIGFAMGILLIGIVGALFFRNEPLTTSDVPSIRREQQLNEHLRSRDVAVYLEGRSDSSGSADEDRSRRWTLPELLRDLNDRNDGVPLPIAVNSVPGSAPDRKLPPLMPPSASTAEKAATTSTANPPSERIPIAGQTPVPSAAPRADSSASVLPVGVSPDGVSPDGVLPVGPSPDPAAEPADPGDFDEYVVRYGDTLSQIAQRLLGSQARFQEIFEINRDRLEAPDRLQVGKAIRIPRN